MNARLDVSSVTRAYTQAFSRLRALPGFDQRQVLRAEMASILKSWAGETPVSTQREVNFRARTVAAKRAFDGQTKIDRVPYGITVNTGLKGGHPGEVWFRHPSKRFQQAGLVSSSGTFTASWIHWRSESWRKIEAGAAAYGAELARELPAAKHSIGLARQSIVQSADALGIDLAGVAGRGISASAVGKARAAVASSGRAYRNGAGTAAGDATRCYIEAVNRLPYAAKIGMGRTVLSILARRAKYIETSYRKGAFDSMASVSKAFPNLLIVKNLN